jgi:uncharacterized membrane protein
VTGYGREIIELSVLLFTATPMAKVAFSVLAFAVQRDRLYVLLTLIVLAVVMISLAGGQLKEVRKTAQLNSA